MTTHDKTGRGKAALGSLGRDDGYRAGKGTNIHVKPERAGITPLHQQTFGLLCTR